MLSDDQIKKYQILYYERFGVRLGRAEVCEKLESLVKVVELTYKPITKKEMKLLERRKKELSKKFQK
jgi:hypothetical protein